MHYAQNLNIRTVLEQQTRPRALQQNIAIVLSQITHYLY